MEGGALLQREKDLDIPLFQKIVQGGKRNQPQHREQAGHLLPQLAQHRAKKLQLHKIAAADAQPLGQYLVAFLQAGKLENIPRILGEQVARLGEADAFAGAEKEPGAQLIFQGADLVAHRRLGDVQLLRRPGKVEKIGHRQKAFQLGGVHGQTS